MVIALADVRLELTENQVQKTVDLICSCLAALVAIEAVGTGAETWLFGAPSSVEWTIILTRQEGIKL